MIPWRLRKGKACVRPENEQTASELPPMSVLGERLNRPLIRPLSLEPPRETGVHSSPAVNSPPNTNNANREASRVALPPPPAKHIEREKFFQKNKADGSALAGQMDGLSIHSRNGSHSHSGSFDSSDWYTYQHKRLWFAFLYPLLLFKAGFQVLVVRILRFCFRLHESVWKGRDMERSLCHSFVFLVCSFASFLELIVNRVWNIIFMPPCP